MLNKTENIKVKGYRGTYYVIDETWRNGMKYFLLEHEDYGDEVPGVIVNIYGGSIGETWDDIETGLDDLLDA